VKKSEKIKTSGEMNREIESDSSRVGSELDRIRERLENPEGNPALRLLLKLLCGILIGVGAVLPGVSGGVLCVIFGIYPVVMDFISHPFSNFKNKIKILMPYIVGIFIGFWGVSKMLEMLLTRFEAPCICLFIGLVAGMLPSLFVSVGEGKRRVLSYLGLSLSCITVLGILVSLRAMSVEIEPSFLWYIFCGCALAFSVIVPGMSFSTLLMPLGLYTPFVQGIGDFNLIVLIPAGVGALVTFIAFSRLIANLFDKHYSVAQNIVVGIVIAATAVIIPFESFGTSILSALANILCLAAGIALARLLSRLNSRYDSKKTKSE
jgi:putative membrane protein